MNIPLVAHSRYWDGAARRWPTWGRVNGALPRSPRGRRVAGVLALLSLIVAGCGDEARLSVVT